MNVIKKIMFLCCSCAYLTINLLGNVDHLFVLEDVYRPRSILVDDLRIYIAEPTTVHIYDVLSLKKIGQFGNAGPGPEEFQPLRGGEGLLSLIFHNDMLAVGAQQKVNFYKRDGRFLRSNKIKIGVMGVSYVPFKDGFVGSCFVSSNNKYYVKVTISSKEFKTKKEVFSQPIKIGFYEPFLMAQLISYTVAGENLYVINDFKKSIDVHQFDGEVVRSIPILRKLVPFTKADKIKAITDIVGDSATPESRNVLNELTAFPDFYPLGINVLVDDNLIYLTSWEKKEGENILTIFDDSRGQQIKEVSIPVSFLNSSQPYPFTYHNGYYYSVHMVLNEDEEIFELIRKKVK